MLLNQLTFVLPVTREVKVSNFCERHSMLVAYLGLYSPLSFSNYFLTYVLIYFSSFYFLSFFVAR